jgi:hypothetical protein
VEDEDADTTRKEPWSCAVSESLSFVAFGVPLEDFTASHSVDDEENVHLD